MLCLALWPGLERFLEEFEKESSASLRLHERHIVPLGLSRVTVNTDGATVFPPAQARKQRPYCDPGPAKTVVLPRKGHASTAEEMSLLKSVDIRIAEEGEVTVVDVSLGTEEYGGGSEG